MTVAFDIELLQRATALADIALALGEIKRATRHGNGIRETNTTHTVMVCLLAADLAPDLGLSRGDAVLFALIHDIVEVYAGDTNTVRGLSPEEARTKTEREKEALWRLAEKLGHRHWIVDLIERYEKQIDVVARFVRYVDKAAPRLTHVRNACSPAKTVGMSKQEYVERNALQREELRVRYPELSLVDGLFQAACRAAEDTFDRPSAFGASNDAETLVVDTTSPELVEGRWAMTGLWEFWWEQK